jgi:hypothetical protein
VIAQVSPGLEAIFISLLGQVRALAQPGRPLDAAHA